MSLYAGHVKPKNLLLMGSSLDSLEDSKANALISLRLKNPLLTLIISLVLVFFAIDRFYLGHYGLGIVKLLLGWLTFGIWWVVDWFLKYRAAQRINLEKITGALHLAKS